MASKDTLDKLTWPPSKPDGVSLIDLVTALQFLATDEDRAKGVKETRWDADTPGSLQVIKSGVTSMTKWWLKRAGAAGGAAGLLAAISGVLISSFEPFRNSLGVPMAVALVAAGAVIISATVLALAHFVTGDLRARSYATAARTAARADVARAYLAGPGSVETPGDLRLELIAAFGAFDDVHVRVKGEQAWAEAVGVRRGSEGFQVRLKDGDWKPLAEIEQYTTVRSAV
ncbi:hypothetical protein [Actinoplanes sp. NPDC049265]|uniref:hypothetical protein n=1 Tax=Actinoplanes sp. NPDC049265 TaxID=3363902 RepID=UPI0037214E0E